MNRSIEDNFQFFTDLREKIMLTLDILLHDFSTDNYITNHFIDSLLSARKCIDRLIEGLKDERR